MTLGGALQVNITRHELVPAAPRALRRGEEDPPAALPTSRPPPPPPPPPLVLIGHAASLTPY